MTPIIPSDDKDKLQWLIDRAAITETVYLYATGIDTRDFELYRSIFTDDMDADFTSYHGMGDGYMAMKADDWVAGLKGLFPGLDATQHSMSNPRITIDGDKATCVVYMQAEHFLANNEGDSSHAIGGYYTDDLVRTPDGWKIQRVKLTVLWQRGNKHMMQLGAAKAAALLQS